jgi:hypothetical protein
MHSTTVATVCAPWAEDGARWPACVARVAPALGSNAPCPPGAPGRRAPPRGEKRGAGRGDAGPKHEPGAQGIARPANQGSGWAPLPGAPVKETAMVLCPPGLNALTQGANAGEVARRGAWVQLDGGFASRAPRQGLLQAGRLPTLPEPPRHRTPTQAGRQRVCTAARPAVRMRLERTWAWAEQGKRWLLRFARRQPRHDGMQGWA